MRNLHSFCVGLLTACGFTFLYALPAIADTAGDVKAAYTAWDEAFKKGDAKAIAAFYADDALILPADHEVYRGPAGAEKFFSGVLSAAKNHKLVLIEARGEGNTVYGAARWSADGKDKDGKPQPWKGVATHIFQKGGDGKLKIKLHTFN